MKVRAGKDCVLPRGETEVQGISEPSPKGLFAFPSPIGRLQEAAGEGTPGDLQSNLCTVDSRQQTADYSLEWKWRTNLPRDILFCILK